jgi:outer membrane protein OmpA-like peptidoglycan-associated protein
MASKTYSLLTGVFCLFTLAGISQRVGTSYDVKDSSLVPSKRMPQHTEFLNGTYNFPAKPRNQWEVGIKGGAFSLSSDVPALFPTPGFGVHVRKAMGYIFSLRMEYTYGIAKGLNWQASENFAKNPAWSKYAAPVDRHDGGPVVSSLNGLPFSSTNRPDLVYYNYKSKVQDLTLQGIFTLNNIRFHKSKTGLNAYAIVGFGGMIYDTKINALDGNNNPYNFSSISGNVYKNRKETRKALKSLMDKTYETPAENHGVRRAKLFGQTFRFTGTVGAGIAYKINNRFNIALEDRIGFAKDDLMDGQRWAEQPRGDAALTGDYDTYNFVSLGLNVNLGAKSVEPLWWLNPLDYAYSEIRNPRLMKLPKPVLPDSDGDGITDQFDLEPNTPKGCPVDAHGVSRDSDGDGVPDCKDKELITPTYCQPVDADGVGKCPVPCPDPDKCDLCKNCKGATVGCAQKMGALPSVSFAKNSNRLSDDAKAVLATVASKMRNNPECKVVVVGYCSSDKKEQQLSWDHVNAIITYLVEKEGVNANRFIFNYGQDGGDCNTVDLRAANEGEEGPNTVPAPHPNLRKNK